MRWIVLATLLMPSVARGQFYHGHGGRYVGGGFGHVAFGYGFGYQYHYHYAYRSPFFGVNPFYFGPGYPFAVPFYYTPPVIQVQAVPRGIFAVRFDDEISREVDLNEFIVVRPKKQNPPRLPAPELLPPLIKVPELNIKPADLPLEPKRAADPRVEMNRQLDLGRAAMEEVEFGRALHRFDEAIRAMPQSGSGYFHRAQAEFALGKYREAVASIVEGIKLRPDWSSARFQPRALYGNQLGLYDLHLQELRNALMQRPDDPALLFLLGYQFWFDGRRGEATPLLEKARDRSRDPEPIRTFLLGGLAVMAK